MISKLENYNIQLKYNQNPESYSIFTYERIILRHGEQKVLSLPYFRDSLNKYIHFEIDYNLAIKGLIVLWNNLNKESSRQNLQFLIKSNMNENVLNNSQLDNIIGKGKVDVKSGEAFGIIYI